MFERHRVKKAAKAYQSDLARWEKERDGYAELLEVAQGYKGSVSEEITLGADEAVFYKATGAALIEERRGQGHYRGGSSGVSIPVGSIAGPLSALPRGRLSESLRTGRAGTHGH